MIGDDLSRTPPETKERISVSASATGTTAPRQSPWLAFTVCAVTAILTILDLVKVNVVLTPIRETLGATTTDNQLIVAGYVLAFGVALVPAGRLGDTWNRKSMFLIGLVTFTIASLVAMLSISSTMLVTARIVQGIAAGTLMPQVLGIIQNLFQGQERGKALGFFGASIGLGTSFGPAVGGLFIGALGPELGWRWTFGMNVPLVIIVLPLAIWLLPKDQPRDVRDRQLDLVGVGLLAATVLFMMLPFVLTSGTDQDIPARWLLLVLGVIAGAGFVIWEFRYKAQGKSPVLDFALFRYSSYRYGVIITSLWFAMMPPLFLVMTLYNQQGLGHSALVVGLITVPWAVVSAIAAAWVGRYTLRYAPQLVFAGLILFIIALLSLALGARIVSAEYTPLIMAIIMGVAGIAPGIVMSANQMRSLIDVPLPQAGVAGSFYQVGQRVGNAIGVAVATAVFYSMTAHLPVNAGKDVEEIRPETAREYLNAFDVSILVLVVFGLVALFVAIVDWRGSKRTE
ncbi:MFS transporter [Auritidibacter sp. NML130574]|nr:MFS transporter [Auritidibacter sp. NML130574]PXA78329.1 MFS transporter [Auritidibacter sp. NML100628]PXA81095.1 MFS transporter [Auritidibacter sp. NML120636]